MVMCLLQCSTAACRSLSCYRQYSTLALAFETPDVAYVADTWFAAGETLYIAHEEQDINPARKLANMYLEVRGWGT